MHPLFEKLQNPLMRESNSRARARLREAFSDLERSPDAHYLRLRPYIVDCPQRFFDREAYGCFLRWLEERDRTDSLGLKDYLQDQFTELDRALQLLRQVNLEAWHDELPKEGDEYERVRFIDKHVHPAYLRLSEAVLVPLTRIVAYFSRLDRGKGTDGLDIWSIVEELSGSPAECLVSPYHHIVRNGIAHGGITYLQNEIRYRDKKANEDVLSTYSVVRLCDDMVDVCNGLAAALSVFLVLKRQDGYALPQALFVDELREETRCDWWWIDGCVPCEIGAQKQLLIYARPNSRDYLKIQMATIQSGILAECLAPGYDRYFFSLRSPKAWPGWAGFDGKKLAELRSSGTTELERYQGVVEDDLIFYVPRPALPRWLGKLDTLLRSWRIHVPLVLAEQRSKLGAPAVICRDARLHRNSWGSVLNGAVVIEELLSGRPVELVRTWRKRIVRTALRSARKAKGRVGVARFLPLGFARVSVFLKDYRSRRLTSFGLGPDLVCTLQFQRLRRIRCPDIFGSTVEVRGKWRIAWNQQWVEETGQQIDGEGLGSAGAPPSASS